MSNISNSKNFSPCSTSRDTKFGLKIPGQKQREPSDKTCFQNNYFTVSKTIYSYNRKSSQAWSENLQHFRNFRTCFHGPYRQQNTFQNFITNYMREENWPKKFSLIPRTTFQLRRQMVITILLFISIYRKVCHTDFSIQNSSQSHFSQELEADIEMIHILV